MSDSPPETPRFKTEPLNLLTDLIDRARRAGAEAADAVMVDATSLQVSHRLGNPEDLERSDEADVGLRVLIGKSQASVSSSDFSTRALNELVERAVAMAKATPEDKYCGLADADLLAKDYPELDLADATEPTPDQLYAMAATCEAAALAVPGVTNSEEAGASWGRHRVALATSHGFAGTYASTSHGLYAAVLAGEGTGMERDYEHTSAHFASDLDDAATVGRLAGERAVRRLKPRKLPTKAMPVVFDPRVSRSLLGHFLGAITGPAVARGTSFLKDKLGLAVFAEGISIVDDPHRRRGLRSKPFDGEGVANRRTVLIDDGRLTTWLLDSASARQLGLATTGHASRGTGGPPSPGSTNVWLQPGKLTPEELIADIAEGFYVTEMMGMGVNGVTGDYSRGAAGFRIENGTLSHPVSEMTVAGNLKDMFRQLVPANDLVFRYGVDAPTLRIEGMTVAGQ
jgi:PmbA protein